MDGTLTKKNFSFFTRIVNERLGTCTRISIFWQRTDSKIFTRFCFLRIVNERLGTFTRISILWQRLTQKYLLFKYLIFIFFIWKSSILFVIVDNISWLSLWKAGHHFILSDIVIISLKPMLSCSNSSLLPSSLKSLRPDHLQFLDSESH